MGFISSFSNLLGLSNTWSQNQVFSGSANTCANTAPASSNSILTPTSMIGTAPQIYFLRLTSNIQSSSTGYVTSTDSVTVPAGTYFCYGSTSSQISSSTAGVNSGLNLSANNDTNFAGTWVTGTATTAESVGAFTTFQYFWIRFPNSSSTFYNFLGNNFDGGGSTRSISAQGQAWVTLSASTTIKFQVAQRTTTDSSNAAQMNAGSFLYLNRVA